MTFTAIAERQGDDITFSCFTATTEAAGRKFKAKLQEFWGRQSVFSLPVIIRGDGGPTEDHNEEE